MNQSTRDKLLNFRVFLLLFVIAVFAIWGSAFNCNLVKDWHTDLFVTNIVNLLNPQWPVAAVMIAILFFTMFRKEIARRIDR